MPARQQLTYSSLLARRNTLISCWERFRSRFFANPCQFSIGVQPFQGILELIHTHKPKSSTLEHFYKFRKIHVSPQDGCLRRGCQVTVILVWHGIIMQIVLQTTKSSWPGCQVGGCRAEELRFVQTKMAICASQGRVRRNGRAGLKPASTRTRSKSLTVIPQGWRARSGMTT